MVTFWNDHQFMMNFNTYIAIVQMFLMMIHDEYIRCSHSIFYRHSDFRSLGPCYHLWIVNRRHSCCYMLCTLYLSWPYIVDSMQGWKTELGAVTPRNYCRSSRKAVACPFGRLKSPQTKGVVFETGRLRPDGNNGRSIIEAACPLRCRYWWI